MKNDNSRLWLSVGYTLFAEEGPAGLKVEVISRQVMKSKSSFYHHFADIELFTGLLLTHHLQRAKSIAEREKLCRNIDPDLINLILDVKKDLLFSRQLRINRTVPAFRKCYEQSNELVENALLEVWKKDLGIPDKTGLAGGVLQLVLENFYLQITEQTLTSRWLSDYFNSIRSIVTDLKKP